MPDYTFQWGEVWIVGNGPSASRLLPAIPNGASVLAINDAVFRIRHEEKSDWYMDRAVHRNIALFSLDRYWVKRNREFLTSFHGEKHIALPPLYRTECVDVAGVHYYGWSHAESLSDNPDVIATGQNSGYGAIGLCYLQGTKVIHLIGYDMDTEYMRTYWAPFFRHALPQLARKGIQVWNHNSSSYIDAFPFVH